ncbi:MAG: energy-coupling factor transporter ATPase [Clostridia bacterium]|nr:energy-coupling factor transporter ATPase [Clostridia bacterium]MBQ3014837.1 energy-coupling factor transporter ATPase [Clostridia bacterium]
MDKIYLDHVSYIYGGGTPFEQKALDDVSLGIEAGCITGIIGHTGSGKSTMMQLLNGLATPTSGRVLLDGYDINSCFERVFEEWRMLPEYQNLSKSAAKKAIKTEIKRRRRELCFRVGLVMQYPEYQLFEETVFRDIAFGPQNMGLSEDEVRERVLEAAAFTGVSADWMEKSPFDLSGGQKRRVALAGVIAMRPEVLVLDEPAAGLDPRGRDYIFDGIKQYQRKTKSTVLIVSHSMEDMARYCDRVVVMSDARVLMSGPCEEVFSHIATLADIGLDIPQITRLMRMLKERGLPLEEDAYTVEKAVDTLRRLFDAEKGGIAK